MSLDKDINRFIQVEREQHDYVGEEGNFGDTRVLKQDKESEKEDRADYCPYHGLKKVAKDHSRVL